MDWVVLAKTVAPSTATKAPRPLLPSSPWNRLRCDHVSPLRVKT